MRGLQGLTLGVVALALFLAASATAVGPVTVSSTYTVPGSTVPGLTTGLVLSGNSVTVTASGAVCPFGDSYCPGPSGNAVWNTTTSAFGGFPAPGAPAWGLVARVGSGPWAHVGSGPTSVAGTGVLQFAVNDDLLVDNRGSFTVTVSYACWPGWGYGDENHDHCGPPGLEHDPSARSGDARAESGSRGNAEHGQGHGQARGRSAR